MNSHSEFFPIHTLPQEDSGGTEEGFEFQGRNRERPGIITSMVNICWREEVVNAGIR